MEQAVAGISSVFFGIDNAYVACGIMLFVYSVLAAEKMNQAVVALLAASAVIYLGILNQEQAISAIDFNTIFLLVGMMVIVGIMRKTGIFQYLACAAAKSVNGHPRALLAVMSVVTAVLSAMLDNVTTVMLTVPVVFSLTRQLKVKAYPFLLAQIIFSNIGGTATLIGDPPNIMIGSATHLNFTDFLIHAMPAVWVIMFIFMGIFDFIWGRKMYAEQSNRELMLKIEPSSSLKDKILLIKSLSVLTAVIIGFVMCHRFGFETGTVALSGAAMLMFLEGIGKPIRTKNNRVREAFNFVEWNTIFFFIGLFIVVAGMEHTGVLNAVSAKIIETTNGDFMMTGFSILWVSALLSAFIDNIPFVATMIPVIHNMAGTFGDGEALNPIWWSLVFGACFGGNGTLIGASANVVVAFQSARYGERIGFMQYFKHAFPLMLLSVSLANIYLWIFYF